MILQYIRLEVTLSVFFYYGQTSRVNEVVKPDACVEYYLLPGYIFAMVIKGYGYSLAFLKFDHAIFDGFYSTQVIINSAEVSFRHGGVHEPRHGRIKLTRI